MSLKVNIYKSINDQKHSFYNQINNDAYMHRNKSCVSIN